MLLILHGKPTQLRCNSFLVQSATPCSHEQVALFGSAETTRNGHAKWALSTGPKLKFHCQTGIHITTTIIGRFKCSVHSTSWNVNEIRYLVREKEEGPSEKSGQLKRKEDACIKTLIKLDMLEFRSKS